METLTLAEHRQRERRLREGPTTKLFSAPPVLEWNGTEPLDYQREDIQSDINDFHAPLLDHTTHGWGNGNHSQGCTTGTPYIPPALEKLFLPPYVRDERPYGQRQMQTSPLHLNHLQHHQVYLWDFYSERARRRDLFRHLDELEALAREEKCHMPHALRNSYLASKSISTAMNQLNSVVPSDISDHQRREHRHNYWVLLRDSIRGGWASRPWVLASHESDSKRVWTTYHPSHRELSQTPSSSSVPTIFEGAPSGTISYPNGTPNRRLSITCSRNYTVADPDHPLRQIRPQSPPVQWKYSRLLQRKLRLAQALQGRYLSELVAAAVFYGFPFMPSKLKSQEHADWMNIRSQPIPQPPPPLPSRSTPQRSEENVSIGKQDSCFEADHPRLYRSQEVFRSLESTGAPISYSLSSSDRPPLQKAYKTPSGSTRSANSKTYLPRSSSLHLSSSPRRSPDATSSPRAGSTIARMSSPSRDVESAQGASGSLDGKVDTEEPKGIKSCDKPKMMDLDGLIVVEGESQAQGAQVMAMEDDVEEMGPSGNDSLVKHFEKEESDQKQTWHGNKMRTHGKKGGKKSKGKNSQASQNRPTRDEAASKQTKEEMIQVANGIGDQALSSP